MVDQITYTSYEAARMLQVDESTIRRRCMAGKMAGAYRGVLRKREIWMIPASALGLGGESVLQPISEELERDQSSDPACSSGK